MNSKALYKLTYGLCMLSSKSNAGKVSGCIINTCIQAASNPTRLAICCINGNYTGELIKESGIFTVSLLDERLTNDTIELFGMQSGREGYKLARYQGDLGFDSLGLAYLKDQSNAYLSCKVVNSMDLGSHTLFIGEVVDGEVLSGTASITYEKYRNEIKPKPQTTQSEKKIKGWRCKICGYYYEGAELPQDYTCPLCGHPAEDFEPVYE